MTLLQADLDHIALDCKHPVLTMIDFYISTFGFEPIHVEEYKAKKVPFPSVRASPTTIIDFFPSSQDAIPPDDAKGIHFCFAVSKNEWFELKKELQDKGLEVKCADEKRFGARGFGWSLYVDDPDKNSIEFRYYPSET